MRLRFKIECVSQRESKEVNHVLNKESLIHRTNKCIQRECAGTDNIKHREILGPFPT